MALNTDVPSQQSAACETRPTGFEPVTYGLEIR